MFLENNMDFDAKFFNSLQQRITVGSKAVESFKRNRYKNIVDWAIRGLGLDELYTYKKEYEVLRDFFALRCPECNDNITDCIVKTEKQLKEEVLLELDYDKSTLKCPACGYEVIRLPYNTLVLCIGMRSGKTVTAAIISTYIFHLALALGNIEKRFKLIAGQKLRVSMVATAGKQTEKTVWADFVALLRNAIDQDIKSIVEGSHQHISIDTNTREWNVDNLDFLALHSNSGSLAGGTGCLVVLEEYSRFNITDSARGSDEVRLVVERSMKTLRVQAKNVVDDLFTLMVVVSSPLRVTQDPTLVYIYGNDYKTDILKYGVHIRGKTLGYHYPTWGFNPNYTRKDFDSEYERDYFESERDYGAMPISGANRFFEYLDIVRGSIVCGTGLAFETFIGEFGTKSFWSANCTSLQHVWGKEYCVHVDLAKSHDLLTMAFARVEEGHVYIEGMLVLEPKHGISMYLDTPLNILLELSKRIRISNVTYDGWQSESAIQRLQGKKIQASRLSVGEQHLVALKQLFYDGKITIIDTQDGSIETFDEEISKLSRVDGVLTHTDLLLSIAGAAHTTLFGVKPLSKKQREEYTNSQSAFRKFPIQTGRINRL